ncbi:amino acid adenylation domain-containing protein [Streptomyces sp. NBC_00536]|uniref:non-ribosomal peptide synthetase n=1 Tax=Streptomyces sp. NBC_00536 TaxID=2975769 RepID=UPI002E8133E5|nr:amino acid adenylation domain-containing protein [Streptomyces sp. NBC_00536]WUC82380.1 amino acid adenylation domain-containing protein [Streptomyces sp. NBC_00536]
MQQFAFPATSAQRRIWLVERLIPGTSAYHLPFALHLDGPLDTAALEGALTELVHRHESLRTCFEQADGELVQLVSEQPSFALEIREAHEAADAELEAVLAADAARPFDLARGPLLRAVLHRRAPHRHVLAITVHHLVADMWSIGILLAELGRCYAGRSAELPELPLQYGDFAVWENESRTAGDEQPSHAYWRRALAGAPELLELACDRPRPAVQSLRGAALTVELPVELTSGIRALCRRAGVTPFMALLAAFQAVLARHSGSEDIVVGTGAAVRPAEAEGLIGCFINILPVRTSHAGDPTFDELLGRVRSAALAAFEHQDLPFERMLPERAAGPALSHNPLVQSLLLVQNAPLAPPELPGLAVTVREVPRGGAQIDLNLQIREVGGAYTGTIEYASDLFDAATVERLLGHWRTLLAAAVAAPATRLSALPMLTAAERHSALVEWNDTAHTYPQADSCLHELFERQLASGPEEPAVVGPAGELSYAELDALAERIAGRLTGLGVGPDTTVGLCLTKGPALVAAVLGVLKAGGAYLPLDPAYPAQRLAFMLQDAAPPVVLTERALAGLLPAVGAEVLEVEDAGQWPATRRRPAAGPGPDHLAYVIYTSGSTGTPKGIAVPHRGVVNNLLDLNHTYGIGPGDRVLGLSSPSFDMFVYETLGILAAGGAVVMPHPDRARDPHHWVDLVRRHKVTVWNSAPALADAFVRAGEERGVRLPRLKAAFFGGDWIPVTLPGRFRRLAPDMAFIALGGATEASIHSITHPVGETDPAWTSIPYGRPMVNQQAVILTPALEPAPVGVPGELCLAGTGLTRGYLRRPGLTADRYRPHPGAGTGPVPAGARMYRTGDLARTRADGVIELIGRLDHQVKLRGLRIELDEIEAVLRRQAGIERAVVTARGSGDDRRLIGYLVPDGAPEAVPSVAELRTLLKAELPEYMVPAAFVTLDALPLSPNGKVDRAALPEPDGRADHGAAAYVAPRDETELVLAALWAELLDTDRVGAEDDFFALGGHSLLATRLASALLETFGVELPLRELFEAPTLAEQAVRLTARGRESGTDVAAVAHVVAGLLEMTDEEAHGLLAEHEESNA